MIYLHWIRHGETDWNRQMKLQGHSDLPLNSFGREQAQELSIKLKSWNFQHVYSSDLIRAAETASLALPQQVAIKMELLREINLGSAEGLTVQEAPEKLGQTVWETWRSPRREDFEHRFPGGESRWEGVQRVEHFLKKLKTLTKPQDRIAIFSHGLLIRTFLQICEQTFESNRPTPNCGQFVLQWDPESPNPWPQLLEVIV